MDNYLGIDWSSRMCSMLLYKKYKFFHQYIPNKEIYKVYMSSIRNLYKI